MSDTSNPLKRFLIWLSGAPDAPPTPSPQPPEPAPEAAADSEPASPQPSSEPGPVAPGAAAEGVGPQTVAAGTMLARDETQGETAIEVPDDEVPRDSAAPVSIAAQQAIPQAIDDATAVTVDSTAGATANLVLSDVPAPDKLIQRFLLFGPPESSRTAVYLEAARQHLTEQRPTFGFQAQDARHARYVLLIGELEDIRQETEDSLATAGCQVSRIRGTPEEIAATLQALPG